jgi:hypothetical protein
MLLKVKDQNGDVYTMPSETPKCILEVHYSTSYYQFVVQDEVIEEEGVTFPKKNIIVPLDKSNWIDFLAVNENEIGEII